MLEYGNYYLKPGEIIYSDEPLIVHTVLGSCVSVTMYVKRLKIGAISHCMLPLSSDIHRGEDAMKYVDCALLFMSKKLQSAGAKTTETEVKLFGGSSLFTASDNERGVGAKNVESASQLLKKMGYSIISSDTGGRITRNLYFSLDSGTVYLRKINRTSVA